MNKQANDLREQMISNNSKHDLALSVQRINEVIEDSKMSDQEKLTAIQRVIDWVVS